MNNARESDRAEDAGGVGQPNDPRPSGGDVGLCQEVGALARWNACRRTARQRFSDWFFGAPPTPVSSFRGLVEGPDPDAVGICCSGGGIRSAAFNLGALQALDKHQELRGARYLAAVSGGSYIAAAFTMVAKAWTGKVRPKKDPKHPYNGYHDSNPDLLADPEARPFAPGTPEEQYLRNRTSYLAPGGMDKLYLAYRLVLGILFNVFFLALPLFGATVLLGVFVFRPAFGGHLVGDCTAGQCSAPLSWYMWVPAVAIVVVSALLGFVAMLVRTRRDRSRALLEVWSTRLLVLAGGWALIGAALPTLVAAFAVSGSAQSNATTPGIVGGSGLVGILAGVLAQLRELILAPKKLAAEIGTARQRWAKLRSGARQAVAYLAGALVGPLLLFGIMTFALSLTLAHASAKAVNWDYALMGAGAFVAFAVLYLGVDLTSWSLHPFYKRRLCTAFALKRVKPENLEDGDPVKLTAGIDQLNTRGVAVERDFDQLVPLSKTAPATPWPTLLVCAAANISDAGATPSGRHVSSFTFSPYSIGGPLVGAVPTTDMETAFDLNGKRPWLGVKGRRCKDLSLPAAVAMSGAALSPSMGKMTRRPLTFLMALANVRLGVWVPNPRWVAGVRANKWQRTKKKLFGRARPSYLLCELLGHNRVNAKYLYVTDGGHYENLGLVELLRRGCTKIYCFDASGGLEFKELGDAIALARSELGVDITFEDFDSVVPHPETGFATRSAVLGQITYPKGESGVLVYARTVLTREVSMDVAAYHDVDKRFPNDPTTDQLYTDQRFEAYRELGWLAGQTAVGLMRPAPQAPPEPQPPAIAPPVSPSPIESDTQPTREVRWRGWRDWWQHRPGGHPAGGA